VIQIDMPLLRARGNDILLLAQHFLVRAAAELGRPVTGISKEAGALLLGYGWPGNVRELETCIAGAVAMAQSAEISVEDLPDSVRDHQISNLTVPGGDAKELLTLEEVERRHILQVLAAVGGHRAAAAEVLGLHPSTLYRKLEHYGHTNGREASPGHTNGRDAGHGHAHGREAGHRRTGT
jgi:DNA-binding NtrC family response regulator